ncbi:hypothetical protein P171DRAFT_491117 [Karstenula rhodostoma CBS 690.94]|uniref:Uncharacterized protein n=1 Tax=Karstenula rhodostoma CBS 690.94 TaxID=1392251 RepID=A0A9P4P7U1_9PLEO|nr:hypothetical protein P171DRAFT_491117 [Karstenula rhodostoma CBS 690.94]
MGRGATRGIERHLKETFNSQEIVAQRIFILSGSMQLRALFKAEERHGIYSTDLLEGRISFDSIDGAFRNMTKAMAVFMRTHGEEGLDGYAKGGMWTTVTCIYVGWKWIVFPVTMIGTTGIFLLLVIIDNWGNDTERLWKSSILAMLFCEVDVQQERPFGKEQIAKLARSMSVSPGDKEEALKLTAR